MPFNFAFANIIYIFWGEEKNTFPEWIGFSTCNNVSNIIPTFMLLAGFKTFTLLLTEIKRKHFCLVKKYVFIVIILSLLPKIYSLQFYIILLLLFWYVLIYKIHLFIYTLLIINANYIHYTKDLQMTRTYVRTYGTDRPTNRDAPHLNKAESFI